MFQARFLQPDKVLIALSPKQWLNSWDARTEKEREKHKLTSFTAETRLISGGTVASQGSSRHWALPLTSVNT